MSLRRHLKAFNDDIFILRPVMDRASALEMLTFVPACVTGVRVMVALSDSESGKAAGMLSA